MAERTVPSTQEDRVPGRREETREQERNACAEGDDDDVIEASCRIAEEGSNG